MLKVAARFLCRKNRELIVNTRCGQPNQLAISPIRKHHYQSEIYTSRFEQPGDQTLKDELLRANALATEQPNLARFISAWRRDGHKIARLDPLKFDSNLAKLDDLRPENYGLSQKSYDIAGLLHTPNSSTVTQMTLEEIETYLSKTYSSHIAVEFDFIKSGEEKLWIAREFEHLSRAEVDENVKVELLDLLLKSQVSWLRQQHYIGLIRS
jgi:2-oxoglutarate dehydrogenase complex dehydrogenase (E1) component-like enzyme